MNKSAVPIFAVMGHPNEGKSSVVSTLTEDDSVRISPVPGETRVCRPYMIKIDDREIIRFVDTPGFQQPRQSLKWLSGYDGPAGCMVAEFITAHRDNPDFSHEVELFSPLARGAGIIFVVDGSRPLRQVDIMEMEILRLTGLPRMVVINTKEHARGEFIEDWKHEARKRFNIVRLFNAHRANFAERIDLLESLKHIDPEWQPLLQEAIDAFQLEWQRRIDLTVSAVLELLVITARHSTRTTCRDELQVTETKKRLEQKYRKDIQAFERNTHLEIRRQFRHNLFDLALPPHSIVNEDLFSKKAWRILGLSQWQLAAAGAAGGGLVGAKIDLALAGHSLGAFTALGGLIGGGSAAMGARQATRADVKGLSLGRIQVSVGPLKSDQILFILLDRALIYFSHVSSWAHSRRDLPPPSAHISSGKSGVTTRWDISLKKTFSRYFAAARKGDWEKISGLKPDVSDILTRAFQEISKEGFERLQID